MLHQAALFNPVTSSLIQKHPFYRRNLNSETPDWVTEQHSCRCALYTMLTALLVLRRLVTVSIATLCTRPEVSAMLQGSTEGNGMVRNYGMHYLKPGGSLRVEQGYGGKHSGPQQHC